MDNITNVDRCRSTALTQIKKCKQLILITNATQISKRGREDAKLYDVEIIDGQKLSQLLKKHSVTYKDINQRLHKKRLCVN